MFFFFTLAETGASWIPYVFCSLTVGKQERIFSLTLASDDLHNCNYLFKLFGLVRRLLANLFKGCR